jgi:tRNA (guanine37-N1)-methyltransferase
LTGIYNSYDIIGDIAILRLHQASLNNYAQDVARVIMTVHNNVKVILAQVGPVTGDFRLRRLLHVAGENRTTTVYKEADCLFSVDLEKCYFSPRLSYERSRVARLIKPSETVVNMFAGVGCFSIVIAKRAATARVFSIDVNPAAIQFMSENIRLNKVYGRVIPMLGDARIFVAEQLWHVADRVLMPLPERAFDYLSPAVSTLKSSGGWIHYYDFEHADKNEVCFAKCRQYDDASVHPHFVQTFENSFRLAFNKFGNRSLLSCLNFVLNLSTLSSLPARASLMSFLNSASTLSNSGFIFLNDFMNDFMRES